MAEPFIGEIRMFAGNYAPSGWALCDGQMIAISQNEALFALLQTTYGGDGQRNFALPDLRGRVPVHQSDGRRLTRRPPGQRGGVESVQLGTPQLPNHTHPLQASGNEATSQTPAGQVLAKGLANPLTRLYSTNAPSLDLSPSAIGEAGGSRAHNNLMPFFCVNFIISLTGIFPSRS